MEATTARRLVGEALGTALLLVTVVGSGIMAERLSGGNDGLALLANTLATGAVLPVLILIFAPISGAHLNPAVTVGLAVSGANEYAPGVPITLASTLVYFLGEFVGAFLGAVVAWLAYRKQYDAATEPVLGTFSTGPTIASYGWNVVTEAIGAFVLIYIILRFGDTPSELGPLAVALLVIGIGASLGGPTGYAINPARDLSPRIAHAVLPIRGKGDSNWGYAWVPVVGPLIGAVLGGLLSRVPL